MPLKDRSKLELAAYAVTAGALAPTGAFAGVIIGGPMDAPLDHSTTDPAIAGFNGSGGPIYTSSTEYTSATVMLTGLDLAGQVVDFDLDIDADGRNDFGIYHRWDSDGSLQRLRITGNDTSLDKIFVDYGGSAPLAVPLGPGTEIGPGLVDVANSLFFEGYFVSIYNEFETPETLFTLNQPAFIGLQFDAGNDGTANYGWLQLELTANSPVGSSTVIDGAYNATNGATISTPASGSAPLPGTLALLAAGAAGLGAVRRRRESTARA
jgi:hypothetical protein